MIHFFFDCGVNKMKNLSEELNMKIAHHLLLGLFGQHEKLRIRIISHLMIIAPVMELFSRHTNFSYPMQTTTVNHIYMH